MSALDAVELGSDNDLGGNSLREKRSQKSKKCPNYGIIAVPLKFWAREAEKARLEGEGIFTTTTLGRNITFPINGEMLKVRVVY